MDSFFGIGLFELVMIAVIALLVLGPERLPEAMREVAKWMRQVRNISSEFQSQFSEEFKMLDEINPRRIINDALDPNAQPKVTPGQVKPPTTPSTSQSAGQSAAKPLTAKPVTPPAPKPPAPTAAGPVNTATVQAGATQAGLNGSSEAENTILPPALDAPVAAEPEPPTDAGSPPPAASAASSETSPAVSTANSQEPEASQ